MTDAGTSRTAERADACGSSHFFDELREAGLAVLGTCAGMILCATDVLDGRPEQRGFDLIDLTVRRNGYGRQLDSFETELDVAGLADRFHAVFIRAPFVARVGEGVEVLAEHDGVRARIRTRSAELLPEAKVAVCYKGRDTLLVGGDFFGKVLPP